MRVYGTAFLWKGRLTKGIPWRIFAVLYILGWVCTCVPYGWILKIFSIVILWSRFLSRVPRTVHGCLWSLRYVHLVFLQTDLCGGAPRKAAWSRYCTSCISKGDVKPLKTSDSALWWKLIISYAALACLVKLHLSPHLIYAKCQQYVPVKGPHTDSDHFMVTFDGSSWRWAWHLMLHFIRQVVSMKRWRRRLFRRIQWLSDTLSQCRIKLNSLVLDREAMDTGRKTWVARELWLAMFLVQSGLYKSVTLQNKTRIKRPRTLSPYSIDLKIY